jgi:hypothetical protein
MKPLDHRARAPHGHVWHMGHEPRITQQGWISWPRKLLLQHMIA